VARVKVATSRYYGMQKEIEASGLVPLGHTVGVPRYACPEAGNLGLLAPHGIFGKELSDRQFAKLYRERLEQIGLKKIEAVLVAIAKAYDAPGVVLLCYEDVHAGESCHRRIFAKWWFEHTGEEVPELERAQAAPEV
jgi:hypothetical protein